MMERIVQSSKTPILPAPSLHNCKIWICVICVTDIKLYVDYYQLNPFFTLGFTLCFTCSGNWRNVSCYGPIFALSHTRFRTLMIPFAVPTHPLPSTLSWSVYYCPQIRAQQCSAFQIAFFHLGICIFRFLHVFSWLDGSFLLSTEWCPTVWTTTVPHSMHLLRTSLVPSFVGPLWKSCYNHWYASTCVDIHVKFWSVQSVLAGIRWKLWWII